MGRLVVINNPNAKLNSVCADRYERLAAVLGDEGQIYQTRVPEEIQPIADKLVRQDIEILAVCGGDGTLHHTLTAFIRAWGGEFPPVLLPLKGGAMNTIYKSVGCKYGAEQNLSGIIEKRKRGEPLEIARRNILNVSGRYAFLFGNGIGANILDHYYKGPYDGVRQALHTAFDVITAPIFRTADYERLYGRLQIEGSIDGAPVEFRDMLAVIMGTVRDVGIGARPFYRAEEKEGMFQAIFMGFGTMQAVANAFQLFRARPFKGLVKDELCRRATIRSETPFRYFLDGEIYKDSCLEVSLGPTIRVIKR